MSVATIGEAHSLSWKLTVFCRAGRRDGMKSIRGCTWRLEADLQTMLWTHGTDFPISDLGNRFKCPACGSRQVLVAFEPPSGGARKRVDK